MTEIESMGRPSGAAALAGDVEVTRGGLVESAHRVHVAVVDREGRPVAGLGDREIVTYYRSAAKPFQALPLVEDGVVDTLGLTSAELALCCASHSAEPAHVEVARSILRKAGVDEGALACGAHPPLDQAAAERVARDGGVPGRIHNNCSGKHAGMLALAVHHGWDPAGYERAEHPVQGRMLDEVVRWTGLDREAVATGVDGCGVVCFAVGLDRMALSFARFAAAAARPPRGTPGGPAAAAAEGGGGSAGRVVDAMLAHPFMVGGSGRLCTDLMERAGRRVFAKTGAEGVYCAGVPDPGWGIAVKVEDGGKRAAGVALLRTLGDLGVLDGADLEALRSHADPPVMNTLGQPVGAIRASFRLGEG